MPAVPEELRMSVGFVLGTAFGTVLGCLCAWARYGSARQLWEAAAFIRGRNFERALSGQSPISAPPPVQPPQHPVRRPDEDDSDLWKYGA